MADLNCPLPTGISHEEARDMFKQVRKENPGLQDSAYRREAARRMGVDYDTYLAAWKNLKTPKVKLPVEPLKVPTTLPPGASVRTNGNRFKATRPNGRSESFFTHDDAMRWANGQDVKVIDVIQNPITPHVDVKPKPFVPAPSPPPPVVPAVPVQTVTHAEARAVYTRLRKEMGAVTDSSIRRAAAKELNMDYKAYLSVWKKPAGIPKAATTRTATTRAVQRVPDKGWQLKPVDHVDPKLKVMMGRTTPQGQEVLLDGKRIGRLAKNTQGDRVMSGPIQIGEHAAKGWYAISQDIYGQTTRTLYRTKADALKHLVDKSSSVVHMKASTESRLLADLRAVNPKHNRSTIVKSEFDGSKYGELRYNDNCTSCTQAFELRRRGYDVVAIPMTEGRPLSAVYKDWGITEQLGNAHGVPYPVTVSRYGIRAYADAMPDGARGFISVHWNDGGAHIFNWEKVNGRLVYYDAQNNTSLGDAAFTFMRAKNEVYMARVDNLPLPAKTRLELGARNIDEPEGPVYRGANSTYKMPSPYLTTPRQP